MGGVLQFPRKEETAKPGLDCRKFGYLFWSVIAVLLLCCGWHFLFYRPPLRISEKTTRITGPLMPNGKRVDFIKAIEERIYPLEMKTDDNGFRVFLRTYGDFDNSATGDSAERNLYRLQKYAKLGLDQSEVPLQEPLDDIKTVLVRYFSNENEPERLAQQTLDHILSAPWTLDEFPMLADWLVKSETPLNILVAQAKKKVFAWPIPDPSLVQPEGFPAVLYSIHSSHQVMVHKFLTMLRVRANNRIARGDTDGALNDAIACIYLGRLISRNADSFVTACTGLAYENAGLTIPINAAENYPLTIEQLRFFLAELASLPPRCPLKEMFERERYSILNAVDAELEGYGVIGDSEFSRFLATSCDQNEVFRLVNETYDRVVSGENANDLAEKFAVAMRKNRFLLATPSGRSYMVAGLAIAILFPADEAVRNILDHADCALHFKRIAIALLLYQQEHGRFPDGDWQEAIHPYFLTEGELFPICPEAARRGLSAEQTTYAIVRYSADEQVPRHALFLVELPDAIEATEAFVTPEQYIEKIHQASRTDNLHVASFDGSVNVLSDKEQEIYRLLHREELHKESFPIDQSEP